MKTLESLESLGLSQQEAQMYLGLLESGGALASRAAKNIGIKRTTAYPILQSLALKGIVRVYFEKNKRIYVAERPERIANIFRRKLSSFEDIIPQLNVGKTKFKEGQGVRYLQTTKEILDFYQDMLESYKTKKKKEYCVIGNTGTWVQYTEPQSGIPEYWRQRAKAGVHTRLILTHESRKLNLPSGQLLRTIRYLPPQYRYGSSIDIFQDKILIVGEKLASLGVVIEIPAMIGVFQTIFEMLWDSLPPEPTK